MQEEIKKKKMEDAMAIANYFVTKSNEEGKELTLLKLLKLCYLAHGYLLALNGRSYLSRYDRVEAWKFGPVIPSVYHSFKHYGKNPITKCGTIIRNVTNDDECEVVQPEIVEEAKEVLDFVWNRYNTWTASDLVSLLHTQGPWRYYYRAEENIEIPDEDTKGYYTAKVDYMIEQVRQRKKREEANGN